jgi:hypothetical protein
MNKASQENPDKSNRKRDPAYLLSLGYDAKQVDSILLIAKYIEAFTLSFDDGTSEHFDFREPRLKVVYGGKA